MARHLQQHTWQESAYTLETVKSARWHLGATGRWTVQDGKWRDIMTVTKTTQTFFLQRVHFSFALKRRQVRSALHARMNAEGWENMMDSTCLLMYGLQEMRKAVDSNGQPLFSADVIRAGMQKVLEGYLGRSSYPLLLLWMMTNDNTSPTQNLISHHFCYNLGTTPRMLTSTACSRCLTSKQVTLHCGRTMSRM